MAEDARVLLVSRRIGTDFAKFDVIACVGGLLQHDAVLAIEPLLHALQRACGEAFFYADACHDAHALRLDEDLTFLAKLAADRVRERVIRPAEPISVPARVQHGAPHHLHLAARTLCFRRKMEVIANLGILLAVFHKHARDEHALRNGAFARPEGLEALAGRRREAVEVETVVPVRATDERQRVRTLVCDGILKAPAQVFHERLRQLGIVVEIHHLVENRKIARLAQISRGARDEPEGIVVKARADVRVAAFGQRLILVIRAAVGELRGRDVENALPRALRNQVHKTQ